MTSISGHCRSGMGDCNSHDSWIASAENPPPPYSRSILPYPCSSCTSTQGLLAQTVFVLVIGCCGFLSVHFCGHHLPGIGAASDCGNNHGHRHGYRRAIRHFDCAPYSRITRRHVWTENNLPGRRNHDDDRVLYHLRPDRNREGKSSGQSSVVSGSMICSGRLLELSRTLDIPPCGLPGPHDDSPSFAYYVRKGRLYQAAKHAMSLVFAGSADVRGEANANERPHRPLE